MSKKIKIIESDYTPQLEETINKLLKEGWKLRGSIIKGVNCLVVMMETK
ncbi:hypothetical protein [Maribacter sp. IgM3_T14_3]